MSSPRRAPRLAARLSIVAAAFGTLALGPAAAQPPVEQTVLGPGLYVFQTRTLHATCADDERDGFVSSFVAPIHGVPGSREMRMSLLNSPHWSSWSITVAADGEIIGAATLDGGSGPNVPTNRFTVRASRDQRFVGRGVRAYSRGATRCEVQYDALLRRIDRLE